MDSTLLIVVLVAVGALVAWLLLRGRAPEAPRQALDEKASPKTEPKTDSSVGPKAAEAKPSPSRKHASAPQPASDAKPEAGEAPAQPRAEADRDEAATDTAAAAAAPATPEDEARKERIAQLRKGLASTRGGFIARIAKLLSRRETIDAGLFEEIEEVLITADVGVQTSQRILERLRDRMERGELKQEEDVWTCLREQAVELLTVEAPPLRLDNKPSLILVAGVNGVGKTTTIGKLASRYTAEGKKVLLAAGDTYRAAAVLQLEVWGKRVGCPVVKGKENADPGSVIFDAVTRAREEGCDLVIADTAGRLHTKSPLMDELKKVVRTCTKALSGRPPDQIFLVIDATTGQNAVQQVHMFRGALEITGLVLTKLDGTAKGGVILGIAEQHHLPVRFVGLGERVEDLREFDPNDFVEALFTNRDGETLAA